MKILVVDDEPLARERLKRQLSLIGVGDVVGEAATGREAVELNERLAPDLVLMDIRMPEMDGLEAARHITSTATPPAIIFCTAFDDYALQAFEHRAVGYLLKPVNAEKLRAALDAAHAVTRLQMQEVAAEAGSQRRFLTTRAATGLKMVPLDEVRLFMADQKYVTAIYEGGSMLVDETLRELEDSLGDRVIRVHRNALVTVAHITAMERLDDGTTVLRLAGVDQCPAVSRRQLADVRRRLKSL